MYVCIQRYYKSQLYPIPNALLQALKRLHAISDWPDTVYKHLFGFVFTGREKADSEAQRLADSGK